MSRSAVITSASGERRKKEFLPPEYSYPFDSDATLSWKTAKKKKLGGLAKVAISFLLHFFSLFLLFLTQVIQLLQNFEGKHQLRILFHVPFFGVRITGNTSHGVGLPSTFEPEDDIGMRVGDTLIDLWRKIATQAAVANILQMREAIKDRFKLWS